MDSVCSLGLLFVLVLVGCTDSTREAETQNSTEPSAPGVSASTIDGSLSPLPGLSPERFDRELQGELAHLDPSEDGWNTEVLSERILSTLKEVDVWVRSGREGANPMLFSEGFNGAHADFKALPQVVDRPPYRVRRGAGTQVVDQLAWMKGWPADMETHFKVIQISRGTNGVVSATVLVDRATEALQQNARWKMVWEVTAEDTLRLRTVEIPFMEQVERGAIATPLFADATHSVLGDEAAFHDQLAYGIDHWRDRLDWRFGMEISGPQGIAIGDINGDGRDDVYVCESGGLPNRLFVQQPDGSANDISAQAGLDFIEATHSALIVDWDNDSDQDIAIAVGRHVFIYANEGGRFVQKAVAQSDSVARSMAAADYDSDGDLDLYVCGYFDRSVDSVGLGRPMPYHDANNGVENHLLANMGNWRFQDVTEAVGLGVNNRRFSYAASWEDFDNDGDQDLYVANDFGRNNLYQNDQGRFKDIAAPAGVEDISAGMSVSWADYDQDGLMDVYVGNMFSSAGNRIAYQRQYRLGLDGASQAFKRHARGNSLFQNQGQGGFQDVTLPAGVNMGRWAWSSLFADVNNDSHEDLLVANGMVTSADDTGDL